jgi:hypothetical protein
MKMYISREDLKKRINLLEKKSIEQGKEIRKQNDLIQTYTLEMVKLERRNKTLEEKIKKMKEIEKRNEILEEKNEILEEKNKTLREINKMLKEKIKLLEERIKLYF